MRCEDAETTFVEMIDEALPSERRAQVLGHLQACTTCATEFSAYRDLVARVQAEPVPEPLPRFWEEFLPSLRRRIDREAVLRSQRHPAAWFAGLRSWLVLPRPLVAGLAVAAISVLIVVRLPGFLALIADRPKVTSSIERFMGRSGEINDLAKVRHTEGGRPEAGEPLVVAGEIVDDPSSLAAAIQRLPWVGEIADRLEDAWVWRPEADPTDWFALLSEEEQQLVLDHLRSLRWSAS